MWRYLVGLAGGVIAMGGGLLLTRGGAEPPVTIPPPPPGVTAPAGAEPTLAPLPEASERTREEKRFARYDKDKDGAILRAEYLAARRKAYDKLDRNHDGRLDFEEYAVKTSERFAKADADRSGRLTAAEFATTRVARNPRKAPPCPPASADAD